MKLNMIKLSPLMALIFSAVCCANPTGLLFNANFTGGSFNITTTVPNHIYPAAGIKINTPGYILTGQGTQCIPINNGYCLFTVSNTQQKVLSVSGAGPVSITLCLNGQGPLSCQIYNF